MPRALFVLALAARLHVRDKRHREASPALRSFVDHHFVRVTETLSVWGRGYERLVPGRTQIFEAVRDDRYYVWPSEVATSGRLALDGTTVTAPVLRLTRGPHTLRWNGSAPAPTFAILWLPRDGEQRPPWDREAVP